MIKHFWQAPPGEAILGMITYEDMIVVATTCGVYVIGNEDKLRFLDNWAVNKISAEINRK